MSVPPLIASAPGAASGSLLTKITESSAGTSLYAPASGGGGGGGSNYPANPAFSSITLAATAPIVQDGNPGQVTFQNATTPTIADVSIFTNTTGNSFVTQFQPGGAANSISIRSPANAYALNFGTTDNAGCVIAASVNSTGDQSTLTVIADKVVIPSNLNVSSINGSQYPPSQSDVFSTIIVSSINGSQYPPAVSDVFPSVTAGYVSTPAITNPTGIAVTAGTTLTLASAQSTIITPGNLQMYASGNLTLNGNMAASGQIDTNVLGVGTQATVSSLSYTGVLTGSGIANVNLYNTSKSGNNGAGGGLDPAYVASLPNLIPVGMPGYINPTWPSNMIQAGYAGNIPYTSTITFPRPYPNDTMLPIVVVTPLNTAVPGGQYPSWSMNANWGYNNSGVSTIGFQVDFRYNGVGQTGNFFWIALPATN